MIPKNIFQSWYTKKLPLFIENKINNMLKMNPTYNYKLYIDEEIDSFVTDNFPGEIADCYNKLNIIVAKVDFWRYLILYKYGGIYLDMDSAINISLDKLINHDDEAIITAEKNPNMFVQWALIFNKDHPILKETIEQIIDNIKNNKFPNDIHKMTGPAVFSKAINNIHNKYYNKNVRHNLIHKNFNITFNNDEKSYRIYSIDYNNYFSFTYTESYLLYINKKHWREEEKNCQLVID